MFEDLCNAMLLRRRRKYGYTQKGAIYQLQSGVLTYVGTCDDVEKFWSPATAAEYTMSWKGSYSSENNLLIVDGNVAKCENGTLTLLSSGGKWEKVFLCYDSGYYFHAIRNGNYYAASVGSSSLSTIIAAIENGTKSAILTNATQMSFDYNYRYMYVIADGKVYTIDRDVGTNGFYKKLSSTYTDCIHVAACHDLTYVTCADGNYFTIDDGIKSSSGNIRRVYGGLTQLYGRLTVLYNDGSIWCGLSENLPASYTGNVLFSDTPGTASGYNDSTSISFYALGLNGGLYGLCNYIPDEKYAPTLIDSSTWSQITCGFADAAYGIHDEKLYQLSATPTELTPSGRWLKVFSNFAIRRLEV